MSRCQETRKQVGTKITMCTVEDSQCVNIGWCSPILAARPVNGQILQNMAKNGCFLAIILQKKHFSATPTVNTLWDYQMNLTVGHSEGTTSSNYGLNLQIGPLSMMVMIMVMIMMIVMFLLMLVANRCLDGLFCIFWSNCLSCQHLDTRHVSCGHHIHKAWRDNHFQRFVKMWVNNK